MIGIIFSRRRCGGDLDLDFDRYEEICVWNEYIYIYIYVNDSLRFQPLLHENVVDHSRKIESSCDLNPTIKTLVIWCYVSIYFCMILSFYRFMNGDLYIYIYICNKA